MKKTFAICFCLVFILTLVVIADLQAGEFQKSAPVTKVFQETGYGYSIWYPSDWALFKQPGQTVVFSGSTGTRAYYSTVSIQNLRSTKLSEGKYKDTDGVIDDLRNQLKNAKEVKMSDVETVQYMKDNLKLTGKQFIAEYSMEAERYRQWIVVFPTPSGEIFLAWFYTSPIDQYNDFLDNAKAMMDSWTIRD